MSEPQHVLPQPSCAYGRDSRIVSGNIPFFIAVFSVLLLLPMIFIFGEEPDIFAGVGLTLVMVPGMIWILNSYPNATPYLLIATIYVGLFGVKVQIGSANIRPNMLLALFAAVVIGSQWIFGRGIARRLPFLSWFLAADLVYLVSTLRHPSSIFFWKGIADCVLFLVNVMQFALVVWFLSFDHKAFQKAVRFFLYASTVYACANIIVFVLGELGVSPFVNMLDFFAGETGDFVRVGNFGTTEGTYIGCTVVVLCSLLTISGQNPLFPWRRLLAMLALNSFALILTFSRGPWLAVSMTMLIFVAVMLVRFPFRRSAAALGKLVLALALLTMVGMGLFVGSTGVSRMVADRFEALSALEVGTVADRMQLWNNMWEDWKESPWLGHGAHDYAKFRDDPSQISENFLLEFLHSTGLVGFGLLCLVIGKIVVRGYRLLSCAEGVQSVPFGLPILAGFVAMCLSSLSNPGMTGGFFWVGMALLVCAEELSARAMIGVHTPQDIRAEPTSQR